MNKIFGIGWAKTGTTTLGKCFEILGFNHQSQNLGLVKDLKNEDLSRIMALAGKKESFEDWPWVILYKELDEAFPESKFVLTKRNPDKWIRSYKNMLNKQGDASEDLNEIRRTIYGLPFPNVTKKQLLERYKKHNNEVERFFHNRPDDLLVVDWEEGNGWNNLCEFLGKDIPIAPFPHANKGTYSKNSILSKFYNGLKRRMK